MPRRRKSDKLAHISRGTVLVPRETPSDRVGRKFAHYANISGPSGWVGLDITQRIAESNGSSLVPLLCTCGAPGGWYGHERHCGLVEPASECARPAWQHTTSDNEDLEF